MKIYGDGFNGVRVVEIGGLYGVQCDGTPDSDVVLRYLSLDGAIRCAMAISEENDRLQREI